MYEQVSPLASAPALESDAVSAPLPPFEIIAPAGPLIPFVLSSPHSGGHYPAELLAKSRLDDHTLRLSEDSYVDELFGGAPALGATLLKAVYSRAYVDPNREAFELDPAMFADPLPDHVNSGSERVAIGFGTVAREVARGIAIYRGKLRYSDALARIERIYFPYHRALQRLLVETRAQFGHAVLVDCHSMPSSGLTVSGDRGLPDIVLGDRFGRSCPRDLVVRAETVLRGMGYKVVRNHPYAGGFITEEYGRPGDGVYALQIELNRQLYMDERTLARSPNFARLTADMSRLIGELASFNLKLSRIRVMNKISHRSEARAPLSEQKKSHSA
jgi:N-formylglutamate amidohydrolase